MIQEKKNQKVDYRILSNKKCNVCGRPLKQNVVDRNDHARMCYVCFKLSKGKIRTTRQRFSVSGEILTTKTVDFKKLQAENFLKYKK